MSEDSLRKILIKYTLGIYPYELNATPMHLLALPNTLKI